MDLIKSIWYDQKKEKKPEEDKASLAMVSVKKRNLWKLTGLSFEDFYSLYNKEVKMLITSKVIKLMIEGKKVLAPLYDDATRTYKLVAIDKAMAIKKWYSYLATHNDYPPIHNMAIARIAKMQNPVVC